MTQARCFRFAESDVARPLTDAEANRVSGIIMHGAGVSTMLYALDGWTLCVVTVCLGDDDAREVTYDWRENLY